MGKITSCLWFDTQGEEAATFYTSVFENSRITEVTRYGDAGPREAGLVMTVSFELDGQPFVALNGGPDFTFNEAISFQVECKDQAEVDRFWYALSEGGEVSMPFEATFWSRGFGMCTDRFSPGVPHVPTPSARPLVAAAPPVYSRATA